MSDYDETKFLPDGRERMCVCESPLWTIRVSVDGEVVSDDTVDTSAIEDQAQYEAAQAKAKEAAELHVKLAVAAAEDSSRFRAEYLCPSCGGGIVVEQDEHGNVAKDVRIGVAPTEA